jgi:hypothetical protein
MNIAWISASAKPMPLGLPNTLTRCSASWTTLEPPASVLKNLEKLGPLGLSDKKCCPLRIVDDVRTRICKALEENQHIYIPDLQPVA